MKSLIRKTSQAAGLLAAVSMLTFFLLHLAPGDAVSDSELTPGVTEDATKARRRRLGLDEPLPVRYARWAGSALRGHWGLSQTYGVPVRDLLAKRLPPTVALCSMALALAWMIAFAAGAAAGLARRGRHVFAVAALVLLSIPDVVLALAGLRLAGTGVSIASAILALAVLPHPLRHSISAFEHVFTSPYMIALAGHGVRGFLLLRVALRPAAAELAALAGPAAASALGASVIVEAAFGLPGIGSLLVESVLARDTELVLALVMVSSVLLALAQVAADAAVYCLDPRARVSR